MQWLLLIVALIIHLGFAFVVGLGVIGYLFPEVLESWARRRAERAGLNYEAMVDSPEKYRQVLRRLSDPSVAVAARLAPSQALQRRQNGS